jgi:uncharacterized membrane protein YfcA
MKEKAIVSTITVVASLTGYYYAKSIGKETLPFTMIGGYLGAVIGEFIATEIRNSDKLKF